MPSWNKANKGGPGGEPVNKHLLSAMGNLSAADQPGSAPGSVPPSPSRRGINLLDEFVSVMYKISFFKE